MQPSSASTSSRESRAAPPHLRIVRRRRSCPPPPPRTRPAMHRACTGADRNLRATKPATPGNPIASPAANAACHWPPRPLAAVHRLGQRERRQADNENKRHEPEMIEPARPKNMQSAGVFIRLLRQRRTLDRLEGKVDGAPGEERQVDGTKRLRAYSRNPLRLAPHALKHQKHAGCDEERHRKSRQHLRRLKRFGLDRVQPDDGVDGDPARTSINGQRGGDAAAGPGRLPRLVDHGESRSSVHPRSRGAGCPWPSSAASVARFTVTPAKKRGSCGPLG